MNGAELLFDYAAEILSFDFKGASPATPTAPLAAADAQRLAGRCLAAFKRSGKRHLALLGLGSGAVAAALAAALPDVPEEAPTESAGPGEPDEFDVPGAPGRLDHGALVVCEQDLALARTLRAAGRLDWLRRNGSAVLAVDASAWAVLLLLDRAGLRLDELFVLPNPELAPQDKAPLKALELLLTRSKLLEAPCCVPPPRLSAAAILSPAEPDLAGFFAQLPPWLHELVLVWDAETLPQVDVPEALDVWQTARPLGRDFSAQRNAMLSACTGDWVFYLDADERLSAPAWAALPLLCADPATAAWHFPRITPYPIQERALAGFGLWPDIQLRLFRRTPGLGFVNPVHERLAGLCGPQALALDIEIEHLNRLRKGEAEIRNKLEGFDEAGAGRVRHCLSAEYPSVPRALLASRRVGLPRGLLLPPDIG